MQVDARAAAGRQGAAAGSRYARARPRRRRREILLEIFSPRLLLPSILLFAETTISLLADRAIDDSEAWFLAKAIRGPAPGAQVLEPLHLTRILGPPPDVHLRSLLSFFVFLYLSVCEASKLRSLPFTHPIYVASRYFQ